MSRNKLDNHRPKRQTKTERLYDICQELIGYVKTLGEQQIKLHEVTMQATAQVKVLANIIEVLKTKGIITDDEIKAQLEKAQLEQAQLEEIKIQNAKSDESVDSSEECCDGSEESEPDNEVHTADSEDESTLPSNPSE